MPTIDDAGVPRDSDLPHLDSNQVHILVDELLTSSLAIADPTGSTAVTPLTSRPAARPRTRWRWPAGLAAAVIVVVVLVTTVAHSTQSLQPTVVHEGPSVVVATPTVFGDASTVISETATSAVQTSATVAPGSAPNFECTAFGDPVLTEVAAPLVGWASSSAAAVGIVGNRACFRLPGGGDAGGTLNPESDPVALLGSVPTAGPTHTLALFFWVTEPDITRVEFVSDDPGQPKVEIEIFVPVGGWLAQATIFDDDGVLRFFSGSTLVAERRIGPAVPKPTAPQFTPTGLPCDPSDTAARANAAGFKLTGPERLTFAAIYWAGNSDDTTDESTQLLCLLILSETPVSADQPPTAPEAPIGYLTTTRAHGGTYLWGNLNAPATNILVTDDTGVTDVINPRNLTSSSSGLTAFLLFVLDGQPQISSLQPVDDHSESVGPPVMVN